MKLLTWNIQWGLGCDGNVDLPRIVDTAKALGDADVFCFQEVSRGFNDYDHGEDQPATLATLLPDYTPIFRPAVEITSQDGKPQLFGNMILSRLPVLQVTSHMLPWPAVEARTMQRQGLEVIVETSFGPVSVTTCHLEFHSVEHRAAQIQELLRLHEDRTRRGRLAFRDSTSGPYRTIAPAVAAIVCGDFNLEPEDPLYAEMQRKLADRVPAFVDVWAARHPGMAHAPTAGIADVAQWPGGAHCRDFIFATENLRAGLLDVSVDTETTASDHQPVAVAFDPEILRRERLA
jgi:endonuclease/exonuclease/phosphatase family metal-dependent hydrolase